MRTTLPDRACKRRSRERDPDGKYRPLNLYRMNQDDIALPGRVHDYIVNNLHRSMPIAVICRQFNTNKNKLQESFREHLGVSLHAFMLQGRMEKGAHLLRKTDETVKFIARECGYKKVRSFNKAFKNQFGLSPDQY